MVYKLYWSITVFFNYIFAFNFSEILPEIFLFFFAIFIFLGGLVLSIRKAGSLFFRSSTVVVNFCFFFLFLLFFFNVSLLSSSFSPFFSFNYIFYTDISVLFFKTVLVASFLVYLSFVKPVFKFYGIKSFEFVFLLFTAFFGMYFMLMANDFIMFYLSLELQSFSTYILVSLNRRSLFSAEAALKYFILGAFSSVFLLFGSSLIYGYSGTLIFNDLSLLCISSSFMKTGFIFAFNFFFVALLFKLAIVPFHVWAPDVYDGASLLVTTFLASVSKLSVFFVLSRFVSIYFSSLFFSIFLLVSSNLSLLLGAFGALFQKKVKRFMAYSGINHLGFVLLSLSASIAGGWEASVFYIIIYVFSSLVFFAIFLSVQGQRLGHEPLLLVDLAPILSGNPVFCFCFIVSIFSMAGVPPFLGFSAKFNILMVSIMSGYYFSAFFILFSSVISCFYYLRLIKIVFFEKPFTRGFYKSRFTFLSAFFLIFANFLLLIGAIFFDEVFLFLKFLFIVSKSTLLFL